MTGIHVLLCAAIILNMGFVYIAYLLLVALQQFFYRINNTLESIDSHVVIVSKTAEQIHRHTEKIGN